MRQLLLLLHIFIVPISCITEFNQGCDQYEDVKPMRHFDYELFKGKWYVMQSYRHTQGHNFTCAVTEFTTRNQTNILKHTHWDRQTNETSFFENILLPLRNTSGVFRLYGGVKMTVQRGGLYHYMVLGTDYENFALVWLCNQLETADKSTSRQGLWIYSRQKRLSPIKEHIVTDLIKSNGLSTDELIRDNQFDSVCGSSYSVLPSITLYIFVFVSIVTCNVVKYT